MTTPPPRDWDKELADIDKLIGKAPAPRPEVAAAGAPAGSVGARPARATPARQTGGAGGTWLRVGLGAALGGAMTQWPYPHGCGMGLYLYLGTVSLVALTGLWGAVSAWKSRVAAAHLLALGVVFWGLVLVAGVLLPRTGYAVQTLTWSCP